METAEEILENIMCCTIEEDADLDVRSNYYYQHDDVVKTIEQAQKEAYHEGQSSPKIKRLEWLVSEDTETMLAKIPFNNYYIIDGVDGMIFLTINSQYHIGRYATIDEAKAAAQAGFEKRVKECLE